MSSATMPYGRSPRRVFRRGVLRPRRLFSTPSTISSKVMAVRPLRSRVRRTRSSRKRRSVRASTRGRGARRRARLSRKSIALSLAAPHVITEQVVGAIAPGDGNTVLTILGKPSVYYVPPARCYDFGTGAENFVSSIMSLWSIPLLQSIVKRNLTLSNVPTDVITNFHVTSNRLTYDFVNMSNVDLFLEVYYLKARRDIGASLNSGHPESILNMLFNGWSNQTGIYQNGDGAQAALMVAADVPLSSNQPFLESWAVTKVRKYTCEPGHNHKLTVHGKSRTIRPARFYGGVLDTTLATGESQGVRVSYMQGDTVLLFRITGGLGDDADHVDRPGFTSPKLLVYVTRQIKYKYLLDNTPLIYRYAPLGFTNFGEGEKVVIMNPETDSKQVEEDQ